MMKRASETVSSRDDSDINSGSHGGPASVCVSVDVSHSVSVSD